MQAWLVFTQVLEWGGDVMDGGGQGTSLLDFTFGLI
jgi:hypothetical protein